MKFNAFVKKTLSVVLSLAVLAAGLAFGMTSMAAVGSEIWDGTLKEPTLGGDGSSADNPILITSAAELAWAVNQGGTKHYKLAADIYLNDTSKINFTNGTVAEGYTPNTWFYDNKTYDGSYKM